MIVLKACWYVIKKVQDLFNKGWNVALFKIFNVHYNVMPSTHGRIFLRNAGTIEIGKDVIINSNHGAVPIGGADLTTIRVFENGYLSIGDSVGITNVTICCAQSIVIEFGVFLGRGVRIYDTDFHSLNWSERLKETASRPSNAKKAPVFIRKGAFIGANVMILKGVEIGEQSIIGAGSVVTKSIPSGQIWAGNPARYIRNLRDDEWTRDDDFLSENGYK